jgi:hypothetical protein
MEASAPAKILPSITAVAGMTTQTAASILRTKFLFLTERHFGETKHDFK